MSLSKAALAIARAGLPVFPCRADKRPATKNGFKDATRNPAKINHMFARPRDARMIGVPTGEVSGIVVVDVDPLGMAWFEYLDQLSQWDMGRRHGTPRGGIHLIYAYDPHKLLRNSSGRLHHGVDIRGEGGYVIWPPSPGYEILIGGLPATMPQWIRSKILVTAMRRIAIKPYHPTPNSLANLDAWVRLSTEGERNGRLFWAACRAGAEAEQLTAAGLATGLDEREVRATIRSAMRRADAR